MVKLHFKWSTYRVIIWWENSIIENIFVDIHILFLLGRKLLQYKNDETTLKEITKRSATWLHECLALTEIISYPFYSAVAHRSLNSYEFIQDDVLAYETLHTELTFAVIPTLVCHVLATAKINDPICLLNK